MKKTLGDEELLQTLTDLLLVEGIRNLTVGDMATRLRCSRRRLYGIAPTKEEIFCSIVDRFFQAVLDQSEDIIRKGLNPPVAIEQYLALGVTAASRIGVNFQRDVDESEVVRAIFDRFQQRRTLMLAELVDEGVRRGFFIPCHGLLVSEVILGAAMRIRRPAFLAQAVLTLEEAFQEFYRLLLGGLLVDAANQDARTSDHNE